MNHEGNSVAYGDTVMFVGKDRKSFMRTLSPGGRLQTHYGVLAYDDIIGEPFGSRLQTHLGQDVWMLRPSTDDLITHLKRESQIIFPKDLGYIVMKMGIRPGNRVIEAGTGSGALTLTLATLVGESGHVYSYDRRRKMQQIALANLQRLGLESRATFSERDILEGFDQEGVDALFLDVPAPWEFLEQAHAALRSGGFLGCIVPTMNQVIEFNRALHTRSWFFVQVEEVLLRWYKTLPERVRPDDQMVGHTGYLVFARSLVHTSEDEAESLAAESEPEDLPDSE